MFDRIKEIIQTGIAYITLFILALYISGFILCGYCTRWILLNEKKTIYIVIIFFIALSFYFYNDSIKEKMEYMIFNKN